MSVVFRSGHGTRPPRSKFVPTIFFVACVAVALLAPVLDRRLAWGPIPGNPRPISCYELLTKEVISFESGSVEARLGWVHVSIRGRDVHGKEFQIREDRWQCQRGI